MTELRSLLDKQERAELVALLQGIAVAAVIVALLMVLSAGTPSIQPSPSGPDPFAPTKGNQEPESGPTRFPRPIPAPGKVELIIQQNDQCWIGVPGATCDDHTRTYA